MGVATVMSKHAGFHLQAHTRTLEKAENISVESKLVILRFQRTVKRNMFGDERTSHTPLHKRHL